MCLSGTMSTAQAGHSMDVLLHKQSCSLCNNRSSLPMSLDNIMCQSACGQSKFLLLFKVCVYLLPTSVHFIPATGMSAHFEDVLCLSQLLCLLCCSDMAKLPHLVHSKRNSYLLLFDLTVYMRQQSTSLLEFSAILLHCMNVLVAV